MKLTTELVERYLALANPNAHDHAARRERMLARLREDPTYGERLRLQLGADGAADVLRAGFREAYVRANFVRVAAT